MAFDGELVKMSNGRWARFRRCSVNGGEATASPATILVAVELEEHYQELLRATERSLESYREAGIPVQLRLGPEEQGRVIVSIEAQPPPLVH